MVVRDRSVVPIAPRFHALASSDARANFDACRSNEDGFSFTSCQDGNLEQMLAPSALALSENSESHGCNCHCYLSQFAPNCERVIYSYNVLIPYNTVPPTHSCRLNSFQVETPSVGLASLATLLMHWLGTWALSNP